MTTTKKNLTDLLVDSKTISQARLGLLLLQYNSFPCFTIHIRKKTKTQILEPMLYSCEVSTFLFLRQSVLSSHQPYNTPR